MSIEKPVTMIELLRYEIVMGYLNNQTDESWKKMVENIRILERKPGSAVQSNEGSE